MMLRPWAAGGAAASWPSAAAAMHSRERCWPTCRSAVVPGAQLRRRAAWHRQWPPAGRLERGATCVCLSRRCWHKADCEELIGGPCTGRGSWVPTCRVSALVLTTFPCSDQVVRCRDLCRRPVQRQVQARATLDEVMQQPKGPHAHPRSPPTLTPNANNLQTLQPKRGDQLSTPKHQLPWCAPTARALLPPSVAQKIPSRRQLALQLAPRRASASPHTRRQRRSVLTRRACHPSPAP